MDDLSYVNCISVKVVFFKSILRESKLKVASLLWNKNIMLQKYNRKDFGELEMMVKKDWMGKGKEISQK